MNNNLKTISIYSDSIEANIAKGKLEAEGVRCFLKNETITNNTGFSSMYGGIELMVGESDVERAKDLLL
jgi:hypothetical protein